MNTSNNYNLKNTLPKQIHSGTGSVSIAITKRYWVQSSTLWIVITITVYGLMPPFKLHGENKMNDDYSHEYEVEKEYEQEPDDDQRAGMVLIFLLMVFALCVTVTVTIAAENYIARIGG